MYFFPNFNTEKTRMPNHRYGFKYVKSLALCAVMPNDQKVFWTNFKKALTWQRVRYHTSQFPPRKEK